MKVKVSELIVRYLQRLGIESIFGMPGAHILPVYDALYNSGIRTVLAKHEQGAAFMAGGYARCSGAIGACIATAGPGATNLVTGIANAHTDRLPVLALTGETSTHAFGRGGLQESTGEGGSIDQMALFACITDYRRQIERTDYLGQVLNQVSAALLADSPGPVLLSLPFNVQNESVDDCVLDDVRTGRPARLAGGASPHIDELVELLLAARHPVIVAGYGCIRAGAQAALTRLSELLAIPVTTSLKGKGSYDERSDLALGSLGVTSSGHARDYILERADLLIFLGASYNERTSYLWDKNLLNGKKIVQVDINPAQIGKVFRPDLGLCGDVRVLLEALVERIVERGSARLADGIAAPDANPRHAVRRTGSSTGGTGASLFDARFALIEQFFTRLEACLPEHSEIFDDNIVFAQNFLNLSPGVHYHPNSGISALGHAIPAAIGARLARGRPTFAILGDGGFQMCCMEIMTAVNYALPLTVILFNNSALGLIRKNQCQQYGQRTIDCDFVNPDYALLARSFGVRHQRIATADDLAGAFAALDFSHGINLVEIMVDRDAFPGYQSRR